MDSMFTKKGMEAISHRLQLWEQTSFLIPLKAFKLKRFTTIVYAPIIRPEATLIRTQQTQQRLVPLQPHRQTYLQQRHPAARLILRGRIIPQTKMDSMFT